MGSIYAGEKVSKDVIRIIASLTGSAMKISAGHIVAALESQYAPQKIRTAVYNLKYRKVIQGDHHTGYTLTEEGVSRLEQLKLQPISQSAEWDKTWRIVIYDIPEQLRPARDGIRKLLKELHFQQVQKSAWAHPLPCLKQFVKIRDVYGIEKHLLLLETPHNDSFNKQLKYFRKLYPKL